MSCKEISPTYGLNKPPSRKTPQPEPDTLSLKSICINLFGRHYLKHFQTFAAEHGIDLTTTQVANFMARNYLPDHISPIMLQHSRAYAERVFADEKRAFAATYQHWESSREMCLELGSTSMIHLCLAGQNEKVTVGPWDGSFRQLPQKRLNPREALARGAAPTADGQAAPDGRGATDSQSTVRQEPSTAASDLLDAWFPPRRKNPSV